MIFTFRMTLDKWIVSGLIPTGRYITSDYYFSTYSVINAYFQGTMTYILE
jgi:hypothetical protein